MSSLNPAAKTLYYRITQHRSSIGVPVKTRAVLQAFGLKRRNQVVYAKVSPSSASSLTKIKELVKVELSEEKKTKEEVNQERKFAKGFEVIKNGTSKVYD
ncbi:39S ribosomal protein L33, mitochondrial [Lodderomyces elongisporus]|uniref:39S ribosomal protein L33, mitochondrial n=1 Tax=Lodderomyces elongisporus TaxID=36914 RepID=UPI0029268BE2|nr:39S ribosomal protein L33, mitochondrial [Lodderomyces elongisporus]WLF78274.1 39S ribosomal protein L33, mitochondrial [Lodderomyces elongisporus]